MSIRRLSLEIEVNEHGTQAALAAALRLLAAAADGQPTILEVIDAAAPEDKRRLSTSREGSR